MSNIEKVIDVIIETRATKNTPETFKFAQELYTMGVDVYAVYDSTASIYGRCTPTIMGLLMANSNIKSVEKNDFVN